MKLLSWSSTLITCLRFNYPVGLDCWLLLMLQNGGLNLMGRLSFLIENASTSLGLYCTSHYPQTDKTKSAVLPCEMTSGHHSSPSCQSNSLGVGAKEGKRDAKTFCYDVLLTFSCQYIRVTVKIITNPHEWSNLSVDKSYIYEQYPRLRSMLNVRLH